MRAVRFVSLASGVVIACGVLVGGCKGGGPPPAPMPAPVAVATVEQKDLPAVILAIGTVEALHTVDVTAQVTGLVMEVHFKEGAVVQAGDPLFTIDARPYSATLASAHAQFAKDQALADLARVDAARYEQMRADGIATEQQVAQARANAASLAAAVDADRAAVSSAGLSVQFAKIRAPISGRTGSLLVQAGNMVRAGDTAPLVVLRSFSPTFVRFSVAQDHLPKIRTQLARNQLTTTATPRGEGGTAAQGKVTFVDNTIDPATGTIALKALFDNADEALWPGGLVDVGMELEVTKDAIVVPEAAIQESQDGPFVYVVTNDTAELRRVKVARADARQAVISEGLRAGETVVTDGHLRLRDGAKVAVASPSTGGKKLAEDRPR